MTRGSRKGGLFGWETETAVWYGKRLTDYYFPPWTPFKTIRNTSKTRALGSPSGSLERLTDY
jgi:hypothetical protein